MSYDFTTSAVMAFRNNLKQVDSLPVRFALFNGDVNQDGTIDLNDVIQTFNAASSFAAGYVVTDINRDFIVDLNDILFEYNNSAAFVSVIRP
jgi:hypothetical protein